jgi:signal transduction histidine kinase
MTKLIRVLITDDEEGMRHGIARVLAKFTTAFPDLGVEVAYDLALCASGEEALAHLASDSLDLLLLDLKLPGIDGLEVLRKAVALAAPPCTVMITAYASLATAVEATRNGAFDFIAKPFTPDELRAVVRRATRELILSQRARQATLEQRRARFDMMSVLSHELKAPLGAVEGYLLGIKDGTVREPGDLSRVVDRSLVRLQSMRQMIMDLLDVTRLEAGMKVRDFAAINLRDVAESVLETFAPQAKALSLTCELQSPPDVRVFAVRAELDIVLNNLVSNAVKYNRPGGRLTVCLSGDDGHVEIRVSDTGIGLAENEAGKLFHEFVRIRNTKTRAIEGSGLGLATVKRIAELYQGEARVESVPDQGSTFIVTLNAPEKTP